eukprot:CAMPEP_0184671988 /NCGR_PEP_ID=MMETSP0308-20130426/85824_1 /TAXON_ID=38269 /ORGANISM="Gloeochaete witrockiana, Strain SAG 46.84" /LENGTH=236 /DNA_ID=CAMNT_0027119225 /DNA_START=113 /DNA_END=823 /DNA_ORIENTATION=+
MPTRPVTSRKLTLRNFCPRRIDRMIVVNKSTDHKDEDPIAPAPSRRRFLWGVTKTFSAAAIAQLAKAEAALADTSVANRKSANDGRDDKVRSEQFPRDKNSVIKTESGLRYFDIVPGKGRMAETGQIAEIHYTSRLWGFNGIKLDSTYDHKRDGIPEPFKFRVGKGEVIPGLDEAVRSLKEGGVRRVVVPPSLGYTSIDDKPSPSDFGSRRRLKSVLETNRDATVVFDIELVRLRS